MLLTYVVVVLLMMRLAWARRKYVTDDAIALGPQDVLMAELGIARPDYKELESVIRQVILNRKSFLVSLVL